MQRGRHYAFIIHLVVAGLGLNSPTRAEDPWQLIDAFPVNATAAAREPWVQPERYQPCLLNHEALNAGLVAVAPEEHRQTRPPTTITLPMPDGSLARFAVYESPIMAPELAARFPEIRTYAGQGIDDPAASVRFDWTPDGFHAQILGPGGAVYIDPYWKGEATAYASYFKADLPQKAGFSCLLHRDAALQRMQKAHTSTAQASGAGNLRTYRAAVAATGEYTQFHGGTVAAGMAAIVTAMNRVNGIYETDLGIRMVLVPNNDLIVYTNSATDPYTNSDGGMMLGQNQTTLNTVIGAANYDIGHVFSTGGGGVAFLGVICSTSFKARGVTGLFSPIGDPFYVDYVAHEMGHQFGANHSFNGISSNCCCGNRNSSTAYEPGSGSSIMAYAGICGMDNLQPNSDPIFHSISIGEIAAYVGGFGGSCAQVSDTGNNPPAVDAGPDYTIPALTPFELTAAADDPDGDSLTYTWEQRDLGPEQTLAAADNGLSPILRSWNATPSPTRSIPRLSYLLSNTLPAGEKYPAVNRNMDFRVTVRDNRAGGGLTASDDALIVVTAAAGPFSVVVPNSAITLSSWRTVVWNPAGTAAPPINAANVDILLSIDGGLTFPTVLAAATPNDGQEMVHFPDTPSAMARVKVQASDNIFFDISNVNFTLSACAAPSAPQAEPSKSPQNRFVSFMPGNVGKGIALRVTPIDLPASHAALIGEELWVGEPQFYHDNANPALSFWAAPLECDPFVFAWDSISVVHVYGDEIAPDSLYEVRVAHCDLQDESMYSPALMVQTATWGDVGAPYGPTPDVIDISTVVDRIKLLPNAVGRFQALTQPRSIDPAIEPNVIDIAMVVDAVKGFAYPFASPAPCQP